MVLARTAQIIPEHNPGKVKTTLTAKEIFVLTQVTLKKDTSTHRMVHASCVKAVLPQVSQIQPTDSELNVLLDLEHQPHVMVASNTEIQAEIASHAVMTKFSILTETDVHSDQTALLINTMIHVINANHAVPELLTTQQQDHAHKIPPQ